MLQLVKRIEDELARVQEAVLKTEDNTSTYHELYAAQQALTWVLDVGIAKSPYEMITGVKSEGKNTTAVLEVEVPQDTSVPQEQDSGISSIEGKSDSQQEITDRN